MLCCVVLCCVVWCGVRVRASYPIQPIASHRVASCRVASCRIYFACRCVTPRERRVGLYCVVVVRVGSLKGLCRVGETGDDDGQLLWLCRVRKWWTEYSCSGNAAVGVIV